MQASQSLGGEDLVYIPEFVSAETERYLLSQLAQLFDREIPSGFSTLDFGYQYQPQDGPTLAANFIGPLPDYLHNLATRLFLSGLFQRVPEQVVITQFASDSGTPFHRDSDEGYGDRIALMPLVGSQQVKFRGKPLDTDKSFDLEPRSVLLLSGQYRYQAEHSLKPLLIEKEAKPSKWFTLTFRNVDIREQI